MPKIVLGTTGYVNVPFTKGYIQFNGLLSHGWFGDDGYVKDVYLHHKFLYVKVGGRFPVNISYGLEHYAQWGGVHPNYGPLPAGWDAYKRIFTAHEGNSGDLTTPADDSLNRLGNHLGSRRYGLDIKLKKVWVNFYYQTIFEDNSGKREYFMRDGLWGIALKNQSTDRIINTVLYELFNSTYQSGGIIVQDDGLRLVDNYYNNYLYQSGWTYHGYTIGTPFISSPELMSDSVIGLENNRVIAHHVACAGTIRNINYKVFFTWSANKGTYYAPFPKTRRTGSVMLQLSNDYSLTNGFEAILQFAFDKGNMYGNNLGVGITIRKHGVF
jgi:hypothetical protein